ALMRGARAGRSVAVLFVDVDDFRAVNDTYGHTCGDALLVGLADRLRTALRRPDTAARLGGDEFAVLLEDLDDAAEAEIVARRIFEALRAPYQVNGQAVTARVSIGVAFADRAGDNASNLMRHADVALYAAKGAGKDRRVIFAPGMENDIVGRHRLRGELEQALVTDQFVVHYQPIVDLATGELAGMEALVRWRHPARGLVGPSEFVPMAEESGLILQLGDYVLRTACNALLRLQARYPRRNPMSIAVNISARQLQQPLFVENVLSIVSDSGVLPHAVTLELTESILLEDAPSHIVKLEALQRAGVRIAIDDFGTGYSSLSYLRRLPVDVLKIAKPFVDDLAAEHPNSDFVRGVVRAHVRDAAALAPEEKAAGDYVTAVDRRAEAAALSVLRERTPDIAVLAEESGGRLADRIWVVDPVDGTTNLVRGFPVVGVSVALLEEGRPVAGAVGAPLLGETWDAAEGEGATDSRGTPLRVADRS